MHQRPGPVQQMPRVPHLRQAAQARPPVRPPPARAPHPPARAHPAAPAAGRPRRPRLPQHRPARLRRRLLRLPARRPRRPAARRAAGAPRRRLPQPRLPARPGGRPLRPHLGALLQVIFIAKFNSLETQMKFSVNKQWLKQTDSHKSNLKAKVNRQQM